MDEEEEALAAGIAQGGPQVEAQGVDEDVAVGAGDAADEVVTAIAGDDDAVLRVALDEVVEDVGDLLVVLGLEPRGLVCHGEAEEGGRHQQDGQGGGGGGRARGVGESAEEPRPAHQNGGNQGEPPLATVAKDFEPAQEAARGIRGPVARQETAQEEGGVAHDEPVGGDPDQDGVHDGGEKDDEGGLGVGPPLAETALRVLKEQEEQDEHEDNGEKDHGLEAGEEEKRHDHAQVSETAQAAPFQPANGQGHDRQGEQAEEDRAVAADHCPDRPGTGAQQDDGRDPDGLVDAASGPPRHEKGAGAGHGGGSDERGRQTGLGQQGPGQERQEEEGGQRRPVERADKALATPRLAGQEVGADARTHGGLVGGRVGAIEEVRRNRQAQFHQEHHDEDDLDLAVRGCLWHMQLCPIIVRLCGALWEPAGQPRIQLVGGLPILGIHYTITGANGNCVLRGQETA